MNRVNLIGNLTKDPELRSTNSGISVCRFTIGVKRLRAAQGAEPQSDFINCVAWRKTAENVAKYLSKGRKVGVTGSIQTRKYEDKDGRTVYVTEVVCDEYGGVEFLSPKGESSGSGSSDAAEAAYAPATESPRYVQVDDEELPF